MPQLLFVNNTHMPIIVSSWIRIMDGLSELKDIIIEANTESTVKSDVGEWILSSLFIKEEHKTLWEKEELLFSSRIAKFRSKPCINGDYTWVFIDNFTLTYDNLNKSVTWNYIKNEN
jgi:hypothetical protein